MPPGNPRAGAAGSAAGLRGESPAGQGEAAASDPRAVGGRAGCVWGGRPCPGGSAHRLCPPPRGVVGSGGCRARPEHPALGCVCVAAPSPRGGLRRVLPLAGGEGAVRLPRLGPAVLPPASSAGFAFVLVGSGEPPSPAPGVVGSGVSAGSAVYRFSSDAPALGC